MIRTPHFIYFSVLTFLLTSCGSNLRIAAENITLADETKLLKSKIDFLVRKGISISQQDRTAYGLGWKALPKNPYRRDMNGVVGKFPVVQGWIFCKPRHDLMRRQIVEGHKRGAITTLSWHLDNPETNGSSWDTTPAVKTILKEGINRSKYAAWVSKLADFVKSIKDKPEPQSLWPLGLIMR